MGKKESFFASYYAKASFFSADCTRFRAEQHVI